MMMGAQRNIAPVHQLADCTKEADMPNHPANDDQKKGPQGDQQTPDENQQKSDLEEAQKDAAEKREDEGGYQ